MMLNTDAHNPMADAQLGRADFVAMCQTQVVSHSILPFLVFCQASSDEDVVLSGAGVYRDLRASHIQ